MIAAVSTTLIFISPPGNGRSFSEWTYVLLQFIFPARNLWARQADRRKILHRGVYWAEF